jgi:hypothetical protein
MFSLIDRRRGASRRLAAQALADVAVRTNPPPSTPQHGKPDIVWKLLQFRTFHWSRLSREQALQSVLFLPNQEANNCFSEARIKGLPRGCRAATALLTDVLWCRIRHSRLTTGQHCKLPPRLAATAARPCACFSFPSTGSISWAMAPTPAYTRRAKKIFSTFQAGQKTLTFLPETKS